MAMFDYQKDSDGIVVVTMDMPDQSANTMNAAFSPLMAATVAQLEEEEGLTGVVITSAKKTFFAGGDLKSFLALEKVTEEFFNYVEENKGFLRRLEKLPAPVVAAINGAALGGGYEICLASNHRIVVDDPKAVVGLPEVTLGLLPGAGGVVRLTALLGLEKALPFLLEGKQVVPKKALVAGMVDEIISTVEDLVPRAKAWIKANPESHTQPWDKKGFVHPGGNAKNEKVRMIATVTPTMLVKKTRGLLPAPEKIADIAVNSMRMGFDSALRNESRGFCSLVTTPQARAAISSFFFGMNRIKNGEFRPEGPRWKAKNAAILGAGMMGAGIAWSHASRDIATKLKDQELAKAENGKAYSEMLADKRISRKQMSDADKDQLLSQITPIKEDSDYQGTDIIIEAVFEDIDLKEKVIPTTFSQLGDQGIYGSNTSTLPISLLAKSCPEPDRFIGIHFFSPVDKMKLVEIILGKETSDDTLRKAYDYVQQIGKIPIVVNDARGFFTSRVFGTFCDEGASLIVDGIDPVVIERAAWMVGMPVGPLAVMDEVSQVLQKRVYDTHQVLDERLGVENGFPAEGISTKAVSHEMVAMNRGGRAYGGGYYDYHANGSKSLWGGVRQFAKGNGGVSMKDIQDRIIYRQSIETLRCLDEGVLRSEIEADIGSIFGIGFPAHTGGAIRFIHGVGIDKFAARAKELAELYGPRFDVKEEALEKLRSAVQKAA